MRSPGRAGMLPARGSARAPARDGAARAATGRGGIPAGGRRERAARGRHGAGGDGQTGEGADRQGKGRGRGTRPVAARGAGRRQGTVGGNGSRAAAWHQDSPRSAPRPRASFVTSWSWFFSRFAFGDAAQLLEVGQHGRAWCHNFAKRGRNEVVSPRVIHHATRQPIPRRTVTLRSNGATTSQNPSQTKLCHHMRVSFGCLSQALPHRSETTCGATTSPHTGKTKLCHHTFSSPALPPVSLTWLLVIVCGATTSPITAKTRLWHQRETRWDSTAPEAQPAGPPQKFSRAKTPEKRLDIVPKKAQARIAQAPLRCDASIERSDS